MDPQARREALTPPELERREARVKRARFVQAHFGLNYVAPIRDARDGSQFKNRNGGENSAAYLSRCPEVQERELAVLIPARGGVPRPGNPATLSSESLYLEVRADMGDEQTGTWVIGFASEELATRFCDVSNGVDMYCKSSRASPKSLRGDGGDDGPPAARCRTVLQAEMRDAKTHSETLCCNDRHRFDWRTQRIFGRSKWTNEKCWWQSWIPRRDCSARPNDQQILANPCQRSLLNGHGQR